MCPVLYIETCLLHDITYIKNCHLLVVGMLIK